jgi:hypothetical protein
MRRSAVLCLSGCLTAGILGCSGPSALASSPSSGASVTISLNSGVPESASAPYGKNKVAVVAAYYHAVAAQNYRLAFRYLAPNAVYLAPNATRPGGQRLTWAAFLRLAHELDGLGGPVTAFSVRADGSMIVMTIDRKKYGPYHAHLQVARVRGIWAISSIDRI